MMGTRALFWVLWIFGTITQAFGFLFAQVPRSDSRFLGGILVLACTLLGGSILFRRRAWKLSPIGAQFTQPSRMTRAEVIITAIAIIQLCICVYWIADLLIYGLRR